MRIKVNGTIVVFIITNLFNYALQWIGLVFVRCPRMATNVRGLVFDAYDPTETF